MKILAIDTATESCSVAIVDDHVILTEITLVSGRTHSRHLMPLIRQAAATAEIELADVDGFAVSIGPGSFTGLRIGISTIKGLATGCDRPLVGISTLYTLAYQAAAPDYPICALVDARKREVYCGTYRWQNGELNALSPERVLAPQSVAEDIKEPCIFVGNGALLYADLLLVNGSPARMLAPRSQHLIRAATVAQLSLPFFRTGQTVDAAQLEPMYLRKSDAELSLKS